MTASSGPPSAPGAQAAADRRQGALGAAYALAAFGAWGALPLYYKLIGGVPPAEVVAHRVLWSAVVLFGAVILMRRWPLVTAALADRRVRRALLLSTLLISCNWFVYIWAGACRARLMAR